METGLRVGELIGLTWNAIDFEKHTLTVNKTLEYRHSRYEWRARPPKTVSSYRTIRLHTPSCRKYGNTDIRKREHRFSLKH